MGKSSGERVLGERLFRILLVEDNAADVYLMRQALKGAGLNFELTVIEDGADALFFARRLGKYANSPIPDLAVIDLNLPKNGGGEVLAAMRQSETLSKVPVAIMTSSSAPAEQLRVSVLGVQRFITKPPNLEEFLQIGELLKEVLLERSGLSCTDRSKPR